LVAEALDELGLQDRAVGVAPGGLRRVRYDYFKLRHVRGAHGRAPAVATGASACNPENIVFTYQGEGDLASIGAAEIVHAAARGENITVIFVNNAIYGMTGGQMATSTLLGQKTTTSPWGGAKIAGNPICVSEMISTLDGPALIQRSACTM
jgi:2-oxoglutarate ferredoxin oxidoreductase subunit beta